MPGERPTPPEELRAAEADLREKHGALSTKEAYEKEKVSAGKEQIVKLQEDAGALGEKQTMTPAERIRLAAEARQVITDAEREASALRKESEGKLDTLGAAIADAGMLAAVERKILTASLGGQNAEADGLTNRVKEFSRAAEALREYRQAVRESRRREEPQLEGGLSAELKKQREFLRVAVEGK